MKHYFRGKFIQENDTDHFYTKSNLQNNFVIKHEETEPQLDKSKTNFAFYKIKRVPTFLGNTHINPAIIMHKHIETTW